MSILVAGGMTRPSSHPAKLKRPEVQPTMPQKKPLKKPDRIAAYATLGPKKQTGRRPKLPATVDLRLKQLIKESNT